MNIQAFIDLIIRKNYEAKMYNEVGETNLRATLKKALDEKYDVLIGILNLKMELDAKNCTYNSNFYEKEIKKINKEMREYVGELSRIEI